MSQDKRQHVRTKFNANVTLSHQQQRFQLKTGDISDGGAYILHQGSELPAVGEVVDVQVQGMGGEAPIVKMAVVRADKEGIGLKFL